MKNYASKVNVKIDEILGANEITSDAIREQLNSRAGIVSLKEGRIEYNRNSQLKVAIQLHKNNLKTLQNIESILQTQMAMRKSLVPAIDPNSFGIVESFVSYEDDIQGLLDISTYRNKFARGIILNVLPELDYRLDIDKVYKVPLLNYDDDSLTPESAKKQWISLRRIYARQQGLNPLSNSMYRRQIYAIN